MTVIDPKALRYTCERLENDGHSYATVPVATVLALLDRLEATEGLCGLAQLASRTEQDLRVRMQERDEARRAIEAQDSAMRQADEVIARLRERATACPACERQARLERERDEAVAQAHAQNTTALHFRAERDEARAKLDVAESLVKQGRVDLDAHIKRGDEYFARLKRIDEAAQEAESVLSLATARTFPAPEDAEVRRLGERIGFGALMSAAEKTWREWLAEQDMPLGSEFVAGPCRVTVERCLAALRAALKEGSKSDGE